MELDVSRCRRFATGLAFPVLRRLVGASTATYSPSRWIAAVSLALGIGMALSGFGSASSLIAGILVGGVCLGVLAFRELLPIGTLRAAPGAPAAIALSGLIHMAFYGVDAFVPLTLTSLRGQTAAIAGMAFTAGSLGWTAGTILQAKIVLHWSQHIRGDLTSCGTNRR